MKTPVSGSVNGQLTTTADRFVSINQIGASATTLGTSDQARAQVVPVACTLSDLVVSLLTSPGSNAGWQFEIMKNGVATGYYVTIVGAGSTQTTYGTAPSFVAGDTVSLRISPSPANAGVSNYHSSEANSPAISGTQNKWACTLEAAANTSPMIGSSAQNLVNSGTRYLHVQGALNETMTATLTDFETVIPTTGTSTITDLRILLANSPGTGKSWTFTLYKNGSPTSLSCTIADGASVGSDTNAGHAVSVVAGDTIVIQTTPSAGTPAAVLASWGMVFHPSYDGESFIGYGSSATTSASSTRYESITGPGANNWTTTVDTTRASLLPSCFVKGFTWKATAASGSGSRSITLRRNGADSSITSGTIGTGVTSANVSVLQSFSAGDSVNWKLVEGGTLAAYKIGLLIIIPVPVTVGVAREIEKGVALTSQNSITLLPSREIEKGAYVTLYNVLVPAHDIERAFTIEPQSSLILSTVREIEYGIDLSVNGSVPLRIAREIEKATTLGKRTSDSFTVGLTALIGSLSQHLTARLWAYLESSTQSADIQISLYDNNTLVESSQWFTLTSTPTVYSFTLVQSFSSFATIRAKVETRASNYAGIIVSQLELEGDGMGSGGAFFAFL